MKITEDVLTTLSEITTDGCNATLPAALPRALYVKVNKVLEACGGVWSRKAKAHIFAGNAAELLDRAIVTGEVSTKQDLGFFPTPAPLAKRLVEIAGVKPGDLALEPSAGEGAIVDWIIAVGGIPTVLERDPTRFYMLKAKLEGARPSNRMPTSYQLIGEDDFMAWQPVEPFDHVVMNPPFCKVGLGDHLDHVRHAYPMILPSGSLVSILPAGVKFRADRRHTEFRQWFAQHGGELTDLPDDAFKSSGTRVRTVILTMRGGQ